MILQELNILNYRNIREASLEFSDKLNCFVGLNGQGKTNVLDAIYMLSFAKSAFTSQDSLNIMHGEQMAMVQGTYKGDGLSVTGDGITISCGLRRGVKKQFRRDKKDYSRLIDHIGLIPLVMISPSDQQLIDDGSDERRRFMDVVISQLDRKYLDCLSQYNALLKQRNALLKQYADAAEPPHDLLEVLEWQMIEPAEYIYKARTAFFEDFKPYFERVYNQIKSESESSKTEIPVLRYVSQLQDRDLREAYVKTRQRDLILGWTSQGVHKDELEMRLDEWPLKQVGSQGQQRTFVLAMKLAQALYLGNGEGTNGRRDEVNKPILLLDDIFDRLDSERVERIVQLVQGTEFGQIFITDTDRQHLTDILKPNTDTKIFHVENGNVE
ncbi:MAG: DNA replication and repair protein RecF [Paludibacteraceae bacterium]|nr:DNA replication and repair protein RecF [Paludibacteraceae bacterium]